MAELVVGALLSSFFDVICQKLGSVDFLDYFRRGKLEKFREKLESTLDSINQVLDDAEEKQYKSQYVKKWLGDVKHFAYEVDQLLDEIDTNAPMKKLKVESSSVLSGFIPPFTNPFESRIKELLKELVSLEEKKDILELKPGTCARDKDGLNPKPSGESETTSIVDPDIYGREGDKEEVINLLLSEENDNGNQVPVISIVGLGGMGKTTLAKLVYNDHQINEKFDLKAWVYVSESYDVVGFTKAILESFKFSAEGEDLNLLQEQLQQQLMGKKYLLVMDDVWNAKWKIWEKVLLPFNHGSSGSKIIVTTRDKEVALTMKSTQIHHLKELEDSECWSLFVRHAFHGRDVSHYPRLVSIGKEIVVKCGGLPLAVKTLANLLNRKFSLREWFKILKSDMWCLLDGDGNINPVLRLSYHNLSSILKRCFAYCSIFPKGYGFEKDEVIKLWMADGLLKCCAAYKSEEELGGEVFSDLESISFFQKVMDRAYKSEEELGGDVFVMHDLVNDLAKSASGELCLRIEDDRMQNIPQRTRHIWFSIDLKDGEKKLDQVYKIKGLRSLILKSDKFGRNSFKICKNVQHDIFSRLKHLRMLSFRGCILLELADEISNLQLLRYLDLSNTEITSLPNSICKLFNLETLLLKECELTELPSDFYNLVNLRHLDIEYTLIEKMPKHIGRLNNLQTLTNFVVGEQSGSDIKELEALNNLHGTLVISGLINVIDPVDAAKALKDKNFLEKLWIKYSNMDQEDQLYEFDYMDQVESMEEIDPRVEMEAVLEALQPHNYLEWLNISRFPGKRFPSWLEAAPSLGSLTLNECGFCTHLPPLGQLPSLNELSIIECDGIEKIGEEFYGNNNSSTVAFRSLKSLTFSHLSRFKEWLCPEGCFPSLVTLSITGCYYLQGAELLQHLPPSLQKLEIWNCQNLEGSIIPRGGVPSNLSSLCIYGCPKLIASRKEWGLFQINSLKQFKVTDDFKNVESFPEESFLPPNLNSLTLDCCWKLSVINYRGLLHLNSLKSLTINGCPKLEYLPEEGLPNSLSTLEIYGCCPLLKQRYKKEGGEYWQQISHIPNVIIDDHNQNRDATV